VIDYDGAPTAGRLQIARQRASGQQFDDANYKLRLTWRIGQAQASQASASFTLARSCP
jgi:hypothetical protein